MNDHDRENLNFLLNADEETLRDWYTKMEIDDHEYASEIMEEYAEELRVRHAIIDSEIAIDEKSDITTVANYLKKFTLGMRR